MNTRQRLVASVAVLTIGMASNVLGGVNGLPGVGKAISDGWKRGTSGLLQPKEPTSGFDDPQAAPPVTSTLFVLKNNTGRLVNLKLYYFDSAVGWKEGPGLRTLQPGQSASWRVFGIKSVTTANFDDVNPYTDLILHTYVNPYCNVKNYASPEGQNQLMQVREYTITLP
jgi:hypothetical protein